MNLSATYKERITKLCEQLPEGIDIFAAFVYLHNGEFTCISNHPKAAEDYLNSGLSRADILQSRQFRRGNRVIYTEEYAKIDPLQSEITRRRATKFNFHRIYCLSRFSSDCSLLFASNRNNSPEPDPITFYKKSIEAFEKFCCYFMDNTINIFIEALPSLKKTRFATDQHYRHVVITSRDDPPVEQLTAGESEVLYWAARGKTSEDTAILLGLTKYTLDTYRKRAIAKLNATNITHATYLAQLYNLIA